MKKNIGGFGSIAELTTSKFEPGKIFQFWLLKRNDSSSYSEDKNGRTMKRAYPISYPLKLEELVTIKNEKTGLFESKIIRHCVGESSIFKEEQSPDDKITKIVTKLGFTEGHRNILSTDTNILKFLALSNRNMSNPNRDINVNPVFFLHDGNAVVEKQMQVENDLFEIQSMVRDPKNFDMLVAYARVILSKPEFEKVQGEPQHVIFKMLSLAKGNPKLFKEGLNNPATLRKHYIFEALEEGHLTFSEQNNAIYFRNGELLQQAPIGLSPINIFVDKVIEDRTGNAEVIYRMILKALKKEVEAPKVAIAENLEPATRMDAPIPEETFQGQEEQYSALVDKAILKGVITKKGIASLYINMGATTEKQFTGKKGAKGIVTAMMNEPELFQTIRTMVEGNPVSL